MSSDKLTIAEQLANLAREFRDGSFFADKDCKILPPPLEPWSVWEDGKLKHGPNVPSVLDNYKYTLPHYYFPDFAKYDAISPNSITANNLENRIIILLQDWSSHEELHGLFSTPLKFERLEHINRYGFDSEFKTNKNLAHLLSEHFGEILNIPDNSLKEQFNYDALRAVYILNVFPFVKGGHKSASLPINDVWCAKLLIEKVIDIIRPRLVICLGSEAFYSFIPNGSDKRLLKEGSERSNALASVTEETKKVRPFLDFITVAEEAKKSGPFLNKNGIAFWPQRHTSRDKVYDNDRWSVMAKWFADNR